MLHMSNGFALTIEKPVDGTLNGDTSGVAFSLGGSNTMGAYAQILDGSTDWPADSGDGYWISIHVSSVAVSTVQSNALVTIGIDPAGGTTYTDWIQHLLVTGAGTLNGNGVWGVRYEFPIRVPRGCSLAIKGQSAQAIPIATSYCKIQIKCKPTRPELMRVGSFVQTFGADTANSDGTTVTAGGASEGTYAQLGSSLDKPIWFWEWGWGSSAAAFAATVGEVDIAVGDASNKRRVVRNKRFFIGTAETQTKFGKQGEYGDGAVGDLVYGRVQFGDATGPGSDSMIAYGVGG